jgi:hypothetical protein
MSSGQVAWSGADFAEDFLPPALRDPWNHILIDGKMLPGLANVVPTLSEKIDEKESAGTSGADASPQGAKASRVEVTISIWTAAHWASLQTWLPILRPRPGTGTPRALTISHPVLAAYGIRRLYCSDIRGPTAERHGGIRELRLQLREWYKPKAESIADVAGATTPDTQLDTDAARLAAKNDAWVKAQIAAGRLPDPNRMWVPSAKIAASLQLGPTFLDPANDPLTVGP